MFVIFPQKNLCTYNICIYYIGGLGGNIDWLMSKMYLIHSYMNLTLARLVPEFVRFLVVLGWDKMLKFVDPDCVVSWPENHLRSFLRCTFSDSLS